MPKKNRPATPAKTKKQPGVKPVALPVAIPGTLALIRQVKILVAAHRQVFLRLFGLTWLALFVAVGFTQQAEYADLSAATREAVSTLPEGAARNAAAIGVLLSSVMTGALAASQGEGQNLIHTSLLFLLLLVAVWMIRHLHSGSAVSVRDALYNAGAPVVSSLAVAAIGVVQLVPLAVVVTVLAAVLSTGAMTNTLLAASVVMLILIASVATLYWLTGTIMAFFVVTIPGTYPWAALQTARQLIKGFRLAVLGRILWLFCLSVVLMTVVMLPLVMADITLGLDMSYTIALVIQALSVLIAMLSVAYLYFLYRSIIDVRTD